VHDGSSEWTWEQLAYGFDPTVKAPASDEPTSVEYGRRIGALFSKYLRLDLGADYFCGVQPGLTGAGPLAGCPPMYFQVLSVYPRDDELAEKHEALKRLAAELARQRQAATLKAQNRAIAIRSAKAQRRVLEQQIINTRLDAQNDVKVQKCLILAKVGLDCDGHRQQIVVAGVPATKK
jgi:delta 1-pyrroline-5-carboxylate dehydrogenase